MKAKIIFIICLITLGFSATTFAKVAGVNLDINYSKPVKNHEESTGTKTVLNGTIKVEGQIVATYKVIKKVKKNGTVTEKVVIKKKKKTKSKSSLYEDFIDGLDENQDIGPDEMITNPILSKY